MSEPTPKRTELPDVKLGLVGAGIGSSLSPTLHETEANELGIGDRFSYQLFDIDLIPARGDIERILDAARSLGFAGLNITHPVKQSVIPFLDELSVDASNIGAVNTVVFEGERSFGHNTDWFGYSELARRALVGESTERIVQLGAGGAGSAVAYGQLKSGVDHLEILDLDPLRAESLAASLREQFPDASVTGGAMSGLDSALRGASGIVNSTPMGMAANPGSPVPADLLNPSLWVIDIVYLPLETQLILDARERGVHATGGSGMTVFQAAEAFRLFTGLEPDSERMFRHMQEVVAARLGTSLR